MRKWLIGLIIIIFVIVITIFVYRARYPVYDIYFGDNGTRYLTINGVNYYQDYLDWEISSSELDRKLGYLVLYKNAIYSFKNDSKICAVKIKEKFFHCMNNVPFYREDIYNKKLCRDNVDSAVLKYVRNDSSIQVKKIEPHKLDELFLYIGGKETVDTSKDKSLTKHFSWLCICCYNDELENINATIRLEDRGNVVVANINSFGDDNILISKQLILDIYNGS